MPVTPVTSGQRSFTSPVVDYEPPPVRVSGTPASCPPPSPAALHRHTSRAGAPPACTAVRPSSPTAARESPPPRAAAVFADAALRRVLEVIDRRRPITQLRAALSPAIIDAVAALIPTRTIPSEAAVLRRVRLRTADSHAGRASAAEVFATYTRGRRVRAVAARIERVDDSDRWRLVALQIG